MYRISVAMLLFACLRALCLGALGLVCLPPAGDIACRAPLGVVRLDGWVDSLIEQRPPGADGAVRMVFSMRVRRADGAPARGRVRVSVRCPDRSSMPPAPPVANLHPGCGISAQGRLYAPRGPAADGCFDARAWLACDGIYCMLDVPDAGYVQCSSAACPDIFYRASFAAREKFERAAERMLPEGPRGILAGLLAGDRRGISDETWADFRNSGTVHLLVVSGTHVVALAAACLWCLGAAGLPRAPALPVCVALCWVFAIFCGANPPVVRSACMLTVSAAAWMLARAAGSPGPSRPAAASAVDAAAWSAAVLILLKPAWFFSPSFRLSFAAASGVMFVGPRLVPELQFNGALPNAAARPLLAAARATAGAQVAVLPLLAEYFPQVSCAGFVANLLMVPSAALLMLAGLAAAAVSMVFPAAAPPAGIVLGPLLQMWSDMAAWFARLPFATVPSPNPAWPVPALYAAALAWAMGLEKLHCRFACVCAAVSGLWIAPAMPYFGGPRLSVLPVGNGQSVLFMGAAPRAAVLRSGRTWLFDAGSARSFEKITAPHLRSRGIARIDRLVLTDPAAGHAGGVAQLLGRFRVDRVDIPEMFHPEDLSGFRELSRRKIYVSYLRPGEIHPDVSCIYSRRRAMFLMRSGAGEDCLLGGDLNQSEQAAAARMVSAVLNPRKRSWVVPGHGFAAPADALVAAAAAGCCIISGDGMDGDLPVRLGCARLRVTGQSGACEMWKGKNSEE